MKLFILAAGKGTRLMPLTKNTPKPLLDLGNGNTLLESQLENAWDSKVIQEIVIVTGYLAEQVDAKLATRIKNGERIRTVYNPFYETTNNFVSLWLLRHEMDCDFMVTNGDNLIASSVFQQFATDNPRDGIYLSMVASESCGPDDMKLIQEDKRLKRVSKDIPVEEASGESPGLAMVRGEAFRRLTLATIDEMIRSEQFRNGYWLELFNRLCDNGISVRTWEFSANLWREFDIHMDLTEARELLMGRVGDFLP